MPARMKKEGGVHVAPNGAKGPGAGLPSIASAAANGIPGYSPSLPPGGMDASCFLSLGGLRLPAGSEPGARGAYSEGLNSGLGRTLAMTSAARA